MHSRAENTFYFVYIKRVLYVDNVFLMRKGRSPSYAAYYISCINIYRRPEGGSQSDVK
jgi:hypothetical protein